jgi:hypothetical protein
MSDAALSFPERVALLALMTFVDEVANPEIQARCWPPFTVSVAGWGASLTVGTGFSVEFGLRGAGVRRHLEHVGMRSALPVTFCRSSGRAVMVHGGTDAHGRQQHGRRRGAAR